MVVRFPFALAPVKFAVFPLMEKNDAMRAMAEDITRTLRLA